VLQAKATTEWLLLTSMLTGAKVILPRRGQFQTSPSAVFSPLVGAPNIAVPHSRCVLRLACRVGTTMAIQLVTMVRQTAICRGGSAKLSQHRA
jgi:hypothetical protein